MQDTSENTQVTLDNYQTLAWTKSPDCLHPGYRTGRND
jgi:hypothetical protein